MNTKKLAALILAALLLFTTLAGCGQRVEDPVDPPINTIDPAVTDLPPVTEPEPTTEPITEPPVTTPEPTETTPEVTEPPVTTPEPTTATDPTTKKTDKNDFTVEPMSATMYATQSLNVRKGPSTDFSKIGALSNGEAVTVTGRASTGWYEIDFKGQKGYVSNIYMDVNAPSEKPEELPEQGNPSSGNGDENPEDIDEGNHNQNPSTPVTPGSVTAGDWVKDNFAQTMFDRFTDDRYKSAMNKLAAAVQNLEPYVDLGEYVSANEAYDIASYLAAMVGTTYCYFSHVSGISGTTLSLSYNVNSVSDAQKLVSNLEKQGKKVVKACSSYSDYNKIKYIYEWIVQHSVYDHGTYYSSSYGPIVDGNGTCVGYAKATFYLFSLAGFDCVYGVGKGINDTHIWVKVNIGGKWYNVDTGWGDPMSADKKDSKHVDYSFLCVTDDYMKNTRSAVYDLSTYFSSPSANSESLNWYKLNDAYAESYDEAISLLKAQAKSLLKNMKSGETGYLRIQLSTMDLFWQVLEVKAGSDILNTAVSGKTVTGVAKLSDRNEPVKQTRMIEWRFTVA